MSESNRSDDLVCRALRSSCRWISLFFPRPTMSESNRSDAPLTDPTVSKEQTPLQSGSTNPPPTGPPQSPSISQVYEPTPSELPLPDVQPTLNGPSTAHPSSLSSRLADQPLVADSEQGDAALELPSDQQEEQPTQSGPSAAHLSSLSSPVTDQPPVADSDHGWAAFEVTPIEEVSRDHSSAELVVGRGW